MRQKRVQLFGCEIVGSKEYFVNFLNTHNILLHPHILYNEIKLQRKVFKSNLNNLVVCVSAVFVGRGRYALHSQAFGIRNSAKAIRGGKVRHARLALLFHLNNRTMTRCGYFHFIACLPSHFAIFGAHKYNRYCTYTFKCRVAEHKEQQTAANPRADAAVTHSL